MAESKELADLKADMKHKEFDDEVQPAWEETASPEQLALLKREKVLIKKLDLFIAPVMGLLQLVSYLDRGMLPSLVIVTRT